MFRYVIEFVRSPSAFNISIALLQRRRLANLIQFSNPRAGDGVKQCRSTGQIGQKPNSTTDAVISWRLPPQCKR